MRKLDISPITDYLYIGAQPHGTHAAQLEAWGVRLLISMRGESRPPAELCRPPLRLLWLKTYDTWFTPIPVAKMMEGVIAARETINAGGRVVAYCHQGRHRGPAMGAAILIAMGYSAADAINLIRSRRAVAEPHAWYIRRQIEKFEKQWQSLHPRPVTSRSV